MNEALFDLYRHNLSREQRGTIVTSAKDAGDGGE
jgi:hypothetical protein